MRLYTAKCPKCDNKDGLAVLLGSNGKERTVQCEECKAVYSQLEPQAISRGCKFPYFSGCLGEVVTSRDHENHVASKQGLVPATHHRVKVPKRTKNPHKTWRS